jgi:nucleotide-binding universal stress UspA family protein
MIKDILVNIPVGAPQEAVVNYAITVARAFEAHLAGVTFAFDPVVPSGMIDGLSASMIETFRAESEKVGKAALAKFEQAIRGSGVSVETHLLEAGPTGAAELFGQMARHYDLALVAQIDPEKNTPEELVPEAVLLGSGRPVLVVPYIQKASLTLDRIMVCWDASRAAARAIADAMPFLECAKAVDVVTVARKEGQRNQLPGFDIAHHLARHKLKVELKRIVAGDIDIASALLSHAADSGADMIVMGGYGHSRLREFVLGGVTRGMLGSMTVPVLMSH